VHSATGNIIGTQIGGGAITASALIGGMGRWAERDRQRERVGNTTAFGIFPSGDFELLIHALRRNSLLSILAEPNLVP